MKTELFVRICIKKSISFFPLPGLFQAYRITFKTFGEQQNDQIYKVKATIYQGRVTICPSGWQLLLYSFLCFRAISQHQSVSFLVPLTPPFAPPRDLLPMLYPVIHLPRAGCLTGCLVAIQKSLGSFKSTSVSKASEPHPSGVSSSNKGSFRFSKCPRS